MVGGFFATSFTESYPFFLIVRITCILLYFPRIYIASAVCITEPYSLHLYILAFCFLKGHSFWKPEYRVLISIINYSNTRNHHEYAFWNGRLYFQLLISVWKMWRELTPSSTREKVSFSINSLRCSIQICTMKKVAGGN